MCDASIGCILLALFKRDEEPRRPSPFTTRLQSMSFLSIISSVQTASAPYLMDSILKGTVPYIQAAFEAGVSVHRCQRIHFYGLLLTARTMGARPTLPPRKRLATFACSSGVDGGAVPSSCAIRSIKRPPLRLLCTKMEVEHRTQIMILYPNHHPCQV